MNQRGYRVVFADASVKKAFKKLKTGRTEEKELADFLDRAFDDLEKNPFCGQHVPKDRIPKEYVRKYKAENLWKYNLPNAWRLIYTVKTGTIVIISIIIEWLDHKSYDRKFGYSTT
jgi:mRNA-degrading endonuclease RelE of RelBE toxin-antitoxin system